MGYKQYLFKEAVNCVGKKKTAGAICTETAAKLQEVICGPYHINAFMAKDKNGEIVGSFQEKIDQTEESQRVDLFKWQADPTNPDLALPTEIKNEVLREHCLDWLLCNFDTKGENFLHRASDGHLSSFDKEASFSFIEEEGAQHMSYTYKPHSNDTVYNVMFREYINGRMDLDLDSVFQYVEKVEAMSDEEYLGMFEEMVQSKHWFEHFKDKERNLILKRKQNLRKEYEDFFKTLREQREANLKSNNRGADGKI